MAELADAPDLGSGGVTRGGSTPPSRNLNHAIKSLFLLKKADKIATGIRFFHAANKQEIAQYIGIELFVCRYILI